MRFVSKNSNLRVILKPGLPAEPLTGRASDPGISVKFLDGMLEVNDEVIISKLLVCSACKVDFWPIEDGEWKDPFAHQRQENEPAHIMTEFKYGRPDRTLSSAKKPKLTPEIEKMLNERAIEIAKELLPGMMEQMIKAGIEKQKQTEKKEVINSGVSMPDTQEEIPKRKQGRPPKAKEVLKKEEEIVNTEGMGQNL